MYKRIMKDERGLTLIELIIVMAVIVIIGAMLVPNFLTTTQRAKLKADIQSAVVIENARMLYENETGTELTGATAADRITALYDAGYLKTNYTLQLGDGADWDINTDDVIVIDLTSFTGDASAYANLTDEEKKWVTGISSTPTPSPAPNGKSSIFKTIINELPGTTI